MVQPKHVEALGQQRIGIRSYPPHHYANRGALEVDQVLPHGQVGKCSPRLLCLVFGARGVLIYHGETRFKESIHELYVREIREAVEGTG